MGCTRVTCAKICLLSTSFASHVATKKAVSIPYERRVHLQMMSDGTQEVLLCPSSHYLPRIPIDAMDVKIVKSAKDCALGIF